VVLAISVVDEVDGALAAFGRCRAGSGRSSIKRFFGDLAGVLGPAPVVPPADRPKAEAEAQHKASEQRRQQAEAETRREENERQRRPKERKTVATKPKSAPVQRSGSFERKPGTVFRDIEAPWCPELVVIPAGSFVMGSPKNEKGYGPEEGPQHEVRFAQPFALGRYPVTFDEYDHFCAETGRRDAIDLGWGRGRRPVINVSWEDGQAYCAWLSGQAGQRYRLPSEAEWEYGCRDDDAILDRRHDQHRPGELQRRLHLWLRSEG
jgi:formylglycine-generating enzyme required for sulfatase activity